MAKKSNPRSSTSGSTNNKKKSRPTKRDIAAATHSQNIAKFFGPCATSAANPVVKPVASNKQASKETANGKRPSKTQREAPDDQPSADLVVSDPVRTDPVFEFPAADPATDPASYHATDPVPKLSTADPATDLDVVASAADPATDLDAVSSVDAVADPVRTDPVLQLPATDPAVDLDAVPSADAVADPVGSDPALEQQPQCSDVRWKGVTYSFAEPPLVSTLEECILNYKCKSQIDTIIDQAPDLSTKARLRQLDEIVQNFLELKFAAMVDGTDPALKWGIGRLKMRSFDTSGVYGIAYTKKKPTVASAMNTNIGASLVGCHASALKQNAPVAALVMDLEQCLAAVPEEVIHQILDLRLPGLFVHDDHQESVAHLIALQLCEALHACGRHTCTGTICERLTQLPSKQVVELMTPPTFESGVLGSMADIPVGGIPFITTWPTLRSWLVATGQGRLVRKLPEGECVTFQRLGAVFGPKLGVIQNAIPYCPRVQRDLEPLLNKLNAILEECHMNDEEMDDTMKEQIRNALDAIRHDNFDSYVKPTQEELGTFVRPLLARWLQEMPHNYVIGMERCSLLALEACESEWLADNLDLSSEIDLLPHDPCALRVLQAKSKHRILVVSSYFRSMSEKTRMLARKRSVKAQLAGTSLLVQSGNLPVQHEEELRCVMQSFLMGLTFGYADGHDDNDNGVDDEEDSLVDDDDADTDKLNLRLARIKAMPNGFFLGAPPNVLGVSKSLEIGYAEAIYLREHLGFAKFGKVLTAHGINPHSPMEEDWCCPGTPATAGVVAKPCTNPEDVKKPVMIGAAVKEHPFAGEWCCNKCHRGLERLEVKILQDKVSKGDELTTEQQERLEELEARQQNKRDKTKERRDLIKAEAPEALLDEERNKEATTKKRKLNEYEENPKLKEADLKKRRKDDQKRREKGEKKARGINRFTTKGVGKDGLYPKRIQEKLQLAIQHLGNELNEMHIFWNHIVDVCSAVLVKEEPKGMAMKKTGKGEMVPTYCDFAFRQAALTCGLTQGITNKKHWLWPNYDENKRTQKRLVKKEVLPVVISKMYPGSELAG
ncbi:expressed unknown protein [Seminavis robusta]|uniref:Uncharacterized protein n=1 Tax=Seminavis robusta TaxID=568900 RepID=A0A9N8EC82_9STRA|nr:expressed unknown protein [Seminavis robusta]|eukprot:Sro935_g222000.1 n/a (1063) ;mRNA; f:26287-29475